MRYNAANNWQTRLSGAINSTQETIGVIDASGCPTLPFKLTIENEILNITAAPTTATFTATRGAEDTVAAAHSTSVVVENRLTAEVQNGLWDVVEQAYNSISALNRFEWVFNEALTPTVIPWAISAENFGYVRQSTAYDSSGTEVAANTPVYETI